ncbi:hypothetical protein AgCh_003566 [Apium graveolens]
MFIVTVVFVNYSIKKGIILVFESNKYEKDVEELLKMLKEMYLNMKGTNDEFEVINVSNSEDETCYGEHVEDVSWLVWLATELLPADYRRRETIVVTVGKNGVYPMLRWWRSGGSGGGADDGETDRSRPAFG